MVLDDPFTPLPEGPHVQPPNLIVPANDHSNSSPNSATTPSNPGGETPHAAGGRTPRRVQWTADRVTKMNPQSDGEDGDTKKKNEHAPDLDHVNRALETLTSNQGNDSEDYDYRLDPDSGEDEPQSSGNENETIHDLLKPQGAENVAGYVQLGETDGLPAVNSEEKDKSEAARLVREHTGKWSGLRRRVRSGSVARKARDTDDEESKIQEGKKSGKNVQYDEEKALSTIGEKNEPDYSEPRVSANPRLNPPPMSPGMPHLPGGTSVLSSLLALYNNQHQLDSANTSAATTPQSSRPPSPEHTEHDDEGDRGRSHKRSKSPWKRRKGSSSTSTVRVPPPANSVSSDFGHQHRSKSSSSIRDAVNRVVDDFRDDRPKAARSGAGVFGALVANTASMAAVAAPSSSTLIPASTKPGFHLNRYSLPQSPLPSPPIRPGGFNVGSRPGSAAGQHRDHSESPPVGPSRPSSWYSNDTRDEHGRALSSDNLISMKTKHRTRPSPLNLKSVKSMEKLIMHEPTEDERKRREWESEKKRRKKAKEARKKQEVYIIQHVAAILSRQQFILKLARALMMFGSPTHRLETQIQATAKVLDISAQVVYLPNIMLMYVLNSAI